MNNEKMDLEKVAKRNQAMNNETMDMEKVAKAHEDLMFQNQEDPSLVERSGRIPFCHSLGTDGAVYPSHNYHGGTWAERIASCEQFRSREDDFFICCFPRSGSNWSQNMMKHILGVPLETVTIDLVRWFEGYSNMQLAQFPSPRRFKSHIHYNRLPKGGKSIYIARNPMDNCVATYEILKGYCTFGAEDLTWARYVELYLQGDVLFGSWFEHISQAWHHAKENPDVLFLRYEDMKADEAGTVLKISEFIGAPVSEHRAEQIAELTTFHRMKQDPTANFEWTSLLYNEGFQFIRKGTVGDYRNYFTEGQLLSFKDKLAEISAAGVNCYDEFLT